jgi:hypothetical protein
MADDVRTVAGGDDGINPRAAGDVRGLQLGAHAAGASPETLSPAMARSASSMP